MTEISDLPVLTARGVPVVPASIDGHDLAFIVDTGTPISAIDPALARSFALAPKGTEHIAAAGVGGAVWAPLVSVRDLVFGAAAAHDVVLAEALRTRGSIAGRPLAGVWGTDFLANYDVEFDLPDRRIGLYVEHGRCGTNFTPWDVASDVVPIDVPRGRRALRLTQHAFLTMRLDGKPIRVVLDSGAELPLISRSDAIAAGAGAGVLQADPVMHAVGFGSRSLPVRIHRFDTLQVGDEIDTPVEIGVGAVAEDLLGASWLRHHRVWVSFPNDVMLIARDAAPAAIVTPGGTRP